MGLESTLREMNSNDIIYGKRSVRISVIKLVNFNFDTFYFTEMFLCDVLHDGSRG